MQENTYGLQVNSQESKDSAGVHGGLCPQPGNGRAPRPAVQPGSCPCFASGPWVVVCSNAGSCPQAGICFYGRTRADPGGAIADTSPDDEPEGDVCVTEDALLAFERKMRDDGKADATIQKYTSCVRSLMAWLDGREITHSVLLEYRDFLRSCHTSSTVNGNLSAINAYLEAVGLPWCKLKLQKVQRQIFRPEDRELTMEEYEKLIRTAEESGLDRLVVIMQTICAAGIRVSELQFITVDAAKAGQAEVTLKGKTRIIAIPKDLAELLLDYAQDNHITSGKIFITRNGTPISRKQIWAEMKALSEKADVAASKIFPHNLRHLFAQRYYKKTHDIETLSDALGHTSIETTRIYLSTKGEEHRRIIEGLGLVIIKKGGRVQYG